MCVYQQIKQLITSLCSVSVITWRSFAKSVVCCQALQVVDTYNPETMDPKETAETTFPT